MWASNFSNQWETRYEVNALKIIYDRFLLPKAQDIIETVRLLGRLSMVRSNLKKFFFLFRSKALGHITSKNFNNMICIWYENAQAVSLNKYYLISLSQQLVYLVFEHDSRIPVLDSHMDVFLEGMRFDSVNEQQHHHWDQMNIQQQQQFMKGFPSSQHSHMRASKLAFSLIIVINLLNRQFSWV